MKKEFNLKIGYTYKNTFFSFFHSLKNVLLFELIYKLLIVLLFNPLINKIASSFIKTSGNSVVMNTDIFSFFTSVSGILMIIVLLILSIFIIYFEFAVVLTYIRGGFEKRKVHISEGIVYALKSLSSLFSFSSFGFAFYALAIIPYLNIGVKSSLLPNLEIPAFITGEINKFEGLLYYGIIILFVLLVLLFIYLFIKLIYVLPNMIIHKESFIKSAKKSFKTVKGSFIKVSIILLIAVLLSLGLNYVSDILIEGNIFIVSFLIRVLSNLMQFLASPFFLTIMLVLFIQKGLYKELNKSEIEGLARKLAVVGKGSKKVGGFLGTKVGKLFSFFWKMIKPNTRKQKGIFSVLALTLVCALAIWIYILFSNPFEGITQIIGHRGSFEGVENTIEAFDGAIEQNSDYIELDVLMSKDNVPMVIHDTNLYRLGNQNTNIYSMTEAEIKKITLNQGGYTGKVSSLDEILKYLKGKNKILLELKTHGRENDEMLDIIAKTVTDNGMEDDVIYQALDYNLITSLKEKYPDFTVGFVIGSKLGTITKSYLENLKVDFICVEEGIVNISLVRSVHKLKMKIFVWTINNEESINKLLDLKVDAIITDYPEMVYNAREKYLDEK